MIGKRIKTSNIERAVEFEKYVQDIESFEGEGHFDEDILNLGKKEEFFDLTALNTGFENCGSDSEEEDEEVELDMFAVDKENDDEDEDNDEVLQFDEKKEKKIDCEKNDKKQENDDDQITQMSKKVSSYFP